MTLKQFKAISAVIAALVAGSVSYAATTGNWLIAVPTIGIAIAARYSLRKQVTEIAHDERDLAIAGQAARYTITGFSVFAAFLSLVLFANRAANPHFEDVASTLAYSACALSLAYSVIFEALGKRREVLRQPRTLIIIVAFTILLAMLTARFFAGEDSWSCQGGNWVVHGHPDYAMPSAPCPAK